MDVSRWISDLKSNDEETINRAFVIVYNEYFRLVCFIIEKYLDNYDDVGFVANDVFTNLFKYRTNLDETKNLKYYLTVMAKNMAINFRKSNLSYDELVEDIAYEDVHHSHRFYEAVEFLNKHLSKSDVNIVLLHLIEGQTFKQIATSLNESINTVKSRYRRSINKCQKIAKKEKKHE